MVKTVEILRIEKCPQESLRNKKKRNCFSKLRSFAHEVLKREEFYYSN